MFVHHQLRPSVYVEPKSAEELTEELPCISVSTSICQLSKGEDVVPQFERNETHVACMVGDGHSGIGCKQKLDANSSAILNCLLTAGLTDAMQMCLQVCAADSSGAMVVLTLYTIAERKLQIISVGDASCTVYQNNHLLHAQPQHSCATVTASAALTQSMLDKGFEIEPSQRPAMMPSKDGRTMTVAMKPAYFRWKTQQLIAAGSFVGHRGLGRLEPFLTECVVPKGDFHLVMTSDGVSDMIHPEDTLLATIGVSAAAIVQNAQQRWTTPYFHPIAQEAFEEYNKNGYFRHNPYETIRSQYGNLNGRLMRLKGPPVVATESESRVEFINGAVRVLPNSAIQTREHNQGADDISVLVMTCVS